MSETRRWGITILSILLLGFVGLKPLIGQEAEEPAEREWNCKVGEETWDKCRGRLNKEAKDQANEAQEEAEKAAEENKADELALQRLEERAQTGLTGTGVSSLGNATSRRGFLPGLFSALGVDGVEDRDGVLALTYNSRPFPQLGGSRLSGEVLINQPTVFEQFKAEIPEDDRDDQAKALDERLSDFDDIGFNLVVNVSGQGGFLGRFVSDYDGKLSTALFGEALKSIADKKNEAIGPTKRAAELIAKLRAKREPLIVSKDAMDADELDQRLAEAATAQFKYAGDLLTILDNHGFLKIADLVANQPQLYFTLSGKVRDRIVGPNSYKLHTTYEFPLGANVNRLRAYCQTQADAKQAKDAKAQAEGGTQPKDGKQGKDKTPANCTLEDLSTYIKTNAASIASKDRFKFDLSLGQERPYDFSIPDPEVSLHLDRVNMIEATASYGRSLFRDDEGNDLSRFDFEAKYEHTSGDETRNKRLVVTATLTEKLAKDVDFALSAVWANEPKYRDQVDNAWGARAGLRYKIDRKEK